MSVAPVRDEEHAASARRFESLPPELIRLILSCLPDVTSLLSAALSSPVVYNAFLPVQVSIASQVVGNLLTEELLPEATATWKASYLVSCTQDRLEDFVTAHIQSQLLPPPSWTLKEALSLARLHHYVEYFSRDFASWVSAKFTASADSPTVMVDFPTPAELRRIQRAFYRFELFCNLFKANEPDPYDRYEDISFFDKFAPWENEQLGCVHDYLFHKSCPAFNEITDHDVTWGAAGVEDALKLNDPHIQYILSLGLATLHAVSVAQTYEERHRLIYKPRPWYYAEFLHQALINADRKFDNRSQLVENDLNHVEVMTLLHTPLMEDSDTGPATAWTWAHQDDGVSGFIYKDSEQWLRERGCVFWDRARLEAWPLFQSPWEPPDTSAAEAEVRSLEASLFDWRGCPRRKEIHKVGGSGWWSLDDESKVVYPPGQEPPPKPDMGVGKTSQQAADDFQCELAAGGPKKRPT